MAKQKNDKKKKEKKSVLETFRELYGDFISIRGIYDPEEKKDDSAKPVFYNALVGKAKSMPCGRSININEDGSVRVLSPLELFKIADIWYASSRTNAFEFAKGRLEELIAGIPSEKLAKTIESTMPSKKCPKGFEGMHLAHKNYFEANVVLQMYTNPKEPAMKLAAARTMHAKAPDYIKRMFEKSDIKNKEMWAGLFADLSKYSTAYAYHVFAEEAASEKKTFAEELGKLKPKQVTAYFTELCKQAENEEHLYDTLYALSEPEKGKNKKGKKK